MLRRLLKEIYPLLSKCLTVEPPLKWRSKFRCLYGSNASQTHPQQAASRTKQKLCCL